MTTILEYGVFLTIAVGCIVLVALGRVSWELVAPLLTLILGYAAGVLRTGVTSNPAKPLP